MNSNASITGHAVGGTAYSEADAEYDSDLLFAEYEDFGAHWCSSSKGLDLSRSAFSDGESSLEDVDLYGRLHTYMSQVRFFDFAKTSLRAERESHCCSHPDSSPVGVTMAQKAPIEVPCTMRVRDITDIESILGKEESLDAKLRQLKKDVQRDRLVVNGIHVDGAEITLESVIYKVGSICDSMLSECKLRTLSPQVSNSFVTKLLLKASRSNAGGVSYQGIRQLHPAQSSIVIPIASVTSPIRIRITVGTFGELPIIRYNKDMHALRLRWGLIGEVECLSVFEVREESEINAMTGDAEQSEDVGEIDGFVARGTGSSDRHSSSSMSVSSSKISTVRGPLTLCALYSDVVLFECKLDTNYNADLDSVIAYDSMETGSVTINKL